MFNDDDFDSIEDQFDRPPDGLVDARDYYQQLVRVTDILQEMDYSDIVSKMSGMMLIMNEIYDDDGNMNPDRVQAVITSLSFHVVNLLNNIEDDYVPQYFEYVQKDILSELENEAGSLPYWETEETDD